MKRQRIALALLWIVPALWSSNYLVARLSDGVIAPHALAFWRWLLAALLMLPFVWRGLRDGLLSDPAVWRAERWHLLVLGGLGMWICGAWVYIAGRSTTATNMALIYAATPVLIVLVSARRLHEHMAAAQKVGVALALAGVLFVIAKGDIDNLLQVRFSAGDGWMVAAALAWTAYSVLLKAWPSRLGPAERLVAIIAGGLLWLLPATVVEALSIPTPPLSPKALLLVVVAAVVPGVVSYGAHSFMQRELGAARTALMLYLSPVYGALGAWLVLGERPGWYHLAGGALILPSIWLATRHNPVQLPRPSTSTS